jgi:hypothetical protein
MDNTFAEHFANDWIDSWNSHDLQRILAHYVDDFEMSSPKIIQLTNEHSGTLCGKTAVGAYWAKALQLNPDLHLKLLTILVGVNSVTLYYQGTQGHLAAEVFHFNQEQKVTKAFAHYSILTEST